MDYRDDPEREILSRQMLSTNTFPEVRAAQAALRQWRIRYPNDFNILDAGEQLSLIEDALLEEASPTYQRPVRSEWQQLETRIIDARTVSAITAARRDLRQWVQQHPEEIQAEYLDTLFMLLEVVEDQVSESLSPVQAERELAGQFA
jgi:hypothetical protein